MPTLSDKRSLPMTVDPTKLRPLPKDLWDIACSCCDKPHARWAMRTSVLPGLPADGSDAFALCSLCFLYESAWGKSRRAKTDKLIADVEKEIRAKFPRDPQGRLVKPDDATRIMAAIALSSGMEHFHDKMSVMRRD